MSVFNTADDLTPELVWCRTYLGNEPRFQLTKIVFHNGLDSEDMAIVEDDGQTDWAAVASRIQALLAQGDEFTPRPPANTAARPSLTMSCTA